MEETALLFRHLPKELSVDERTDFLHHFGASRVRVFGQTGKMNRKEFEQGQVGKFSEVVPQREVTGEKLAVETGEANTAFAIFPNKEQASEVLRQLHQVEFLGSVLNVEYAKDTSKVPSIVDDEGKPFKVEDATKDEAEKEKKDLKPSEIKFDVTFNAWGLHHPRPPHLKYQYPPPTAVVLTNIMNALASVPKFYVQQPDVNGLTQQDDVDQREMDISTESESELESEDEEKLQRLKEERPVKRLRPKAIRKPRLKKPRLTDLQEDFSEVAASSLPVMPVAEVFDQAPEASTQGGKKIELKIPTAVASGHARNKNKNEPRMISGWPEKQIPPLPPLPPPPPPLMVDKPPSWQPAASSCTVFEDFSSKPHETTPVPSLMSVPPPSVSSSLDSLARSIPDLVPEILDQAQTHEGRGDKESEIVGGFGVIKPIPKDSSKKDEQEESAQKQWGRSKFVTSTELRKGRLSKSEMRDLNVFKRYEPGEASCRLYIKNVAKQVSEEDLHWLYGRYVDWESEPEQNIFDIRLMKEGRMKGQAFVTLPSEEVAGDALRDTNGFLLKDKALVVQFARSAKAQEDSSSILTKSR